MHLLITPSSCCPFCVSESIILLWNRETALIHGQTMNSQFADSAAQWEIAASVDVCFVDLAPLFLVRSRWGHRVARYRGPGRKGTSYWFLRQQNMSVQRLERYQHSNRVYIEKRVIRYLWSFSQGIRIVWYWKIPLIIIYFDHLVLINSSLLVICNAQRPSADPTMNLVSSGVTTEARGWYYRLWVALIERHDKKGRLAYLHIHLFTKCQKPRLSRDRYSF